MTMRLARLSKDPALMRRAIDMHMAVRRAEKTIRFVLIAFSIHLVISLVMAVVAFTMKISGGTSSLGVAAACALAITLAMLHRAPVAEEREALDSVLSRPSRSLRVRGRRHDDDGARREPC